MKENPLRESCHVPLRRKDFAIRALDHKSAAAQEYDIYIRTCVCMAGDHRSTTDSILSSSASEERSTRINHHTVQKLLCINSFCGSTSRPVTVGPCLKWIPTNRTPIYRTSLFFPPKQLCWASLAPSGWMDLSPS